MIYEIAILPIRPERVDSFRHAFAEVACLLSRAKGHVSHVLAQGIETPHRFNLIVQWQSLEDHTPGFEASEDHQIFMTHLTPYFSQEPRVYHVQGGAFETGAPTGPGDPRPLDKRLNP
ncbi:MULTISPECIES: antibiotic biosynthesis monooxygenase [unclassified Pseudomonas]|uniref:antibiotic biosynthesis monooxygenase family protein n=1 Tax=unclassified Pseudomonas TaxID=196821 RepID=UPI0024475707|nr:MULTISPECIES: antibiotic biosynthesis monooxygenase [unclassified Pseudomonas]MDH0302479.1 antibiotic biosynthesis monooxygenase [Pseudomonas sp. GD04091]MDH1985637.1 antibiotic biosynthesis monooxygenase [Pseudomonas sp. GD03689]